MACESEAADLALAMAAAVIACATVETGIGAIACAAALKKDYDAGKKLGECLRANGIAASDLDQHVDQVLAEAQALEQAANALGMTA